jgi:hypothetical protein
LRAVLVELEVWEVKVATAVTEGMALQGHFIAVERVQVRMGRTDLRG